MRVLVTGASGTIGKPVCEFLTQRGHVVRGLDRVVNRPEDLAADINDENAVIGACSEIDAVVHLAAVPDDAPFLDLVPTNVIGLFNVLNAAQRQGVKRVVLASSVQVSWSEGGTEPHSAVHRAPRNHYALTKLWAEQMGEMYTRLFPITIVAARIGWMVRDEREGIMLRQRRMMSSYISRRDVAHFIACALEAEQLRFEVLYAIGPDGRREYDLETPKRIIGFEPRDHFPEGLPFTLPAESSTP